MIGGPKALNPREWIYVAYLDGIGTNLYPSIWLLKPFRELNKPKPDIRITVEGRDIKLISSSYCHGVHFKDNGKAMFSDNYFDLLPGISKSVRCLMTQVPERIRFHAVM